MDHPLRHLPALLIDETFEAFVFDWDGTAVPDRRSDAGPLRATLEALSAAAVHVFIVSGTHVGNVDGQLRARPTGPGQLHLCLNRGSEVFAVDGSGPALVARRVASAEEECALDAAAAATVSELRARGLKTDVTSRRLNRRKIDLLPVPEWADPPKARIDGLLRAVTERLRDVGIDGLTEATAVAANAAHRAGLDEPRITSDAKHLEIGLTDKSDSARWAATWLAGQGITGRLVLVAGDELGPLGGIRGSDSLMMVDGLARAPVVSVGVEPEGVPAGVVHIAGGPKRFLTLLDAQLARRTAHRVPSIDPDPAWVQALPETRLGLRVAEAIGTLANGWLGTRGSREEAGPDRGPSVAVNGVYAADDHLLPGPLWTTLELEGEPGQAATTQRMVDLRTGVLYRTDGHRDGLRSVRFVSAADRSALALRAEASAAAIHAGTSLVEPTGMAAFQCREVGGATLAHTGRRTESGIAVAARDREGERDARRTIERIAAWSAAPSGDPEPEEALDALDRLESVGFELLLADHRRAWARRWADAEVTIDGDPELQQATRFALFHLLSAAPMEGEAAVGARGLSGDAYGGHVFWDADVYVLPVLAAVAPPAARAMLEYRLRRLPAARRAAAELGRRGARFPWESAADGRDVTPRSVVGDGGKTFEVHTGQNEEHIVADVAWATDHYARWTGDQGFLRGPGRDLVVDTARYWTDRIRTDDRGRGHVDGVMGPDEYHELVDDNAFTNVMARWNLRAGADLVGQSGDAPTATGWRDLAAQLVDGWDPARGIYEQFAGYFDLEPLTADAVGEPPVAADVVLGPERVARSQLVKQADVLMLHHLVPDEVMPGSLPPCLEFYGPRTVHGSSLSPAIHASLYARAGAPDRALDLLRIAARIDLDDLTGTTAGGLHLATMGGLWQALASGFLGLRALAEALRIDPCLPTTWEALALRFRYRGKPLSVRAEHDRLTIECSAPVPLLIRDRPVVRCQPPGAVFDLGPFELQGGDP